MTLIEQKIKQIVHKELSKKRLNEDTEQIESIVDDLSLKISKIVNIAKKNSLNYELAELLKIKKQFDSIIERIMSQI